MICLLSTGFMSEEVLYYYQKVLEQALPHVKFLSMIRVQISEGVIGVPLLIVFGL